MLRSFMWWLLTCLHMSMHGCGAQGADKHFGKVLLTCAIDMRKKIEAAPLLEKSVRSLGTVVENGICRETLPVVLRPFLTSIQCEIAQNPQCFLSLSTSPSIQNGHKRTALWGAGIMFVLDFRWTPPLSTPVEILRRPCRDLSPSSRRRAPVRQRHGESGRSSKDWNPMEITSD